MLLMTTFMRLGSTSITVPIAGRPMVSSVNERSARIIITAATAPAMPTHSSPKPQP
jgi:hypothetical protein